MRMSMQAVNSNLIKCFTAGIVLALLVLPGTSLLAAGLQIAPISLSIPADKKADEVWLRNAGTETVHAQVRVYRWSQDQGEDVLTPDTGMVASPPWCKSSRASNNWFGWYV